MTASGLLNGRRRRGRRRLALGLAGSLLLPLAGCDAAPEAPPQPLPSATLASPSGTAPKDWVTRQGAGFEMSVPPTWENRPEDQRSAPRAQLEIGEPYRGGPILPVNVMVFVEQEEVGPLSAREAVLRALLTSQIPEATLGESTPVTVAGATSALYFDVTYDAPGGESLLGTRVEPSVRRQRELLVDVPGLPKYGFRYNAPDEDFDEQLWQRVTGSIVVRPDGPDASAPAPSG